MIKYALAPGRVIVREGLPLATIHAVDGRDPVEVDALTRDMVRLLNREQEQIAATLITDHTYLGAQYVGMDEQGLCAYCGKNRVMHARVK